MKVPLMAEPLPGYPALMTVAFSWKRREVDREAEEGIVHPTQAHQANPCAKVHRGKKVQLSLLEKITWKSQHKFKIGTPN